MDLAIQAGLAVRAPLAVRTTSASSPDRAAHALATISASYGLSCAAVSPAALTPDALFADTDVLLVRALDAAPRDAQARALDLLRARAKITLADPGRPFLLVALVSGETGLTPLLNDQILLLHTYDDDDEDDDAAPAQPPPIPRATLCALPARASAIHISAEVLRYAHDIATHMRLHRAVGGGVSAVGVRQALALARALAVLNGLAFVTPALAAMAARLVFAHRVRLVAAEKERSLLWGSDVAAVREALAGVSVGDVVEDVLGAVEVPL